MLPDDGEAATPFAYTVGLTGHDLPELVIAGLEPHLSYTLLNGLAVRVRYRAERLTHGQRVANLIADYDVAIVEGPATEALHPQTAYARYGADRVRLQQIVWPDEHGRFPWDDGYEYNTHAQPLLGRP